MFMAAFARGCGPENATICLRYAVQLLGILTEDTRWLGWVTKDLESVLNVLLAGRVVLIGAK
jgi:hypothetical protein